MAADNSALLPVDCRFQKPLAGGNHYVVEGAIVVCPFTVEGVEVELDFGVGLAVVVLEYFCFDQEWRPHEREGEVVRREVPSSGFEVLVMVNLDSVLNLRTLY